MKPQFCYSLLLIFSTTFAGEAEYKMPSQKELQAMQETEIQKRVQDSPELANMLREYEQHKTDQLPEKTKTQAVMEKQDRPADFTPSRDIADKAFERGDYKTALKHYEALGAAGDSAASMTAGLIHAEGAEGIEADKAKAAAWFKRSGDQGGKAGADLYEQMENKHELTAEDRAKTKHLVDEFRKNDALSLGGQQDLAVDPYVRGRSSAIPGTGLQRYVNKSKSLQRSNANIATLSTDSKANFSPKRTVSGEYAYKPEKAPLNHYAPEKEW